MEKPAETDDSLRSRAAFWFAVVAVVGAVLIYGWTILLIIQRFTPWQTVLEKQFAAIVGLPGAAAAAFVLVIFLRQTEGPIEFEAPGFKIKGAAGQLFIWVICFLSMAGAIKWLWN